MLWLNHLVLRGQAGRGAEVCHVSNANRACRDSRLIQHKLSCVLPYILNFKLLNVPRLSRSGQVNTPSRRGVGRGASLNNMS